MTGGPWYWTLVCGFAVAGLVNLWIAFETSSVLLAVFEVVMAVIAAFLVASMLFHRRHK